MYLSWFWPRTELIFLQSPGEGVADRVWPESSCCTIPPQVFAGSRGRELWLLRKRVWLLVGKKHGCDHLTSSLVSILHVNYPLFCIPLLLVLIYVCFLISVLLPVNCCLMLWSLPFMPPILLGSLPQVGNGGRGGGEGVSRGQCSLGSFCGWTKLGSTIAQQYWISLERRDTCMLFSPVHLLSRMGV